MGKMGEDKWGQSKISLRKLQIRWKNGVRVKFRSRNSKFAHECKRIFTLTPFFPYSDPIFLSIFQTN